MPLKRRPALPQEPEPPKSAMLEDLLGTDDVEAAKKVDLFARLDQLTEAQMGHLNEGFSYDSASELEEAVELIVQFCEEVSGEDAQRLYLSLRAHHNVSMAGGYGADFDLSAEIGEQITLCRAMRGRLIDSEGKLNERFSAKEAKEILSASNSLNQTLMKFQKEITNFQRLMQVENAMKKAIANLPRENQEIFADDLERQLAAVGR